MSDCFSVRTPLIVDGQTYTYFSLAKFNSLHPIAHLPFSLKILLENLLRHEDDSHTVTREQIEALAGWKPTANADHEIALTPARVLLQDFTGVPCIVDLAAMRDAIMQLGGKAEQINPSIPVELVIDHSVQVDAFGSASALEINGKIEYQRNLERYSFLRWGQNAFSHFKVVPPNMGIVHQVNLEYLARVVVFDQSTSPPLLYPDTVFGTDSHTTMINCLGVLGWGVGGIEAEAAMLGQASSMLIPQVVGFELVGQLCEGATATDMVLVITQMLRQHGVVGKFVEFFGSGLRFLPIADRATIANMAPEYGATCGIFPIDQQTLDYLCLSGRPSGQIALIEAYAKAQGLWYDDTSPPAVYSAYLRLDLATVQACVAGPKRPQDRLTLADLPASVQAHLSRPKPAGAQAHLSAPAPVAQEKTAARPASLSAQLEDGAVVIAAITSCTNTSNPAAMLGAGLLARQAVAKGLRSQPWVKTSLAPGSRVVTDYLRLAGVLTDLEALGFFVVGYGCTTCIGNSGPLAPSVSIAIAAEKLSVAAVLSGNRNFEGRVHPEVKLNYLASPALVVAFAIAGTVNIDLTHDPLGYDQQGQPVYLRDIWPTNIQIQTLIGATIRAEIYQKPYAALFDGDARWQEIPFSPQRNYTWNPASTYIKKPPYFDNFSLETTKTDGFKGARVLGLFGDSITTDHISPAGAIKKDSPAGSYLLSNNVLEQDFNSYGSRRGNDEVMVRGTFANTRLRNRMLTAIEGGYTIYYPKAKDAKPEQLTIYEAAKRYQNEATPLIVIAGKEYGTGSSRDWAAKGIALLGVKAVLAESFERIHRSNLVGMGILPLQFQAGQSAQTFQIDGAEEFDIAMTDVDSPRQAQIQMRRGNGTHIQFQVDILLLTPKEVEYYQHGGLLPYVVRHIARSSSANPSAPPAAIDDHTSNANV